MYVSVDQVGLILGKEAIPCLFGQKIGREIE
jgi:hypothetical protein